MLRGKGMIGRWGERSLKRGKGEEKETMKERKRKVSQGCMVKCLVEAEWEVLTGRNYEVRKGKKEVE